MLSVFCKNLQTSVGQMLTKHHSDSGDVQLVAKELCHHYENSIYAQTHAQDIHAGLGNIDIVNCKGTFQSFIMHWESQWLLFDKSTPISEQESPAVCKNLLCNVIHSNPNFLRV